MSKRLLTAMVALAVAVALAASSALGAQTTTSTAPPTTTGANGQVTVNIGGTATNAQSGSEAKPKPASCASGQLASYKGALKLGTVPVVFIHGITGDPSIFTKGGTASLAGHVAQLPNTSVWTFSYHDWSIDWVTNTHIGPAFAKAIACLSHVSGHRVIVIAHSMGGLATQYAAAQHDQYGGKVGDRIAHLFTIATPFTGSDFLKAADVTLKNPLAFIGNLEMKATVSAVFSACSHLGQLAYEHNLYSPCSLAQLPDSPVGSALESGSKQIQELPAWPSSLPVTDVAGDIKLKVGVWKLAHSFEIGDIAVTDASATAHNTSGKIIRVYCNATPISVLDSPCYHGNLPANPQVISGLMPDISQAVTLEHQTYQPAANGPNDWASYLPVVNGTVCRFSSTAALGKFGGTGSGVQTLTGAHLTSNGVSFRESMAVPNQPTISFTYLMANNGTVEAQPGSYGTSSLAYKWAGFMVWPTIASLRSGATSTTTVSASLIPLTAAVKSEFVQQFHEPQVNMQVTFKASPLPVSAPITVAAGTFKDVIGIQYTPVSVNEQGAPAGTNAQINKALPDLVGTVDDYFGYGRGLIKVTTTQLGGALTTTTGLQSCST